MPTCPRGTGGHPAALTGIRSLGLERQPGDGAIGHGEPPPRKVPVPMGTGLSVILATT